MRVHLSNQRINISNGVVIGTVYSVRLRMRICISNVYYTLNTYYVCVYDADRGKIDTTREEAI